MNIRLGWSVDMKIEWFCKMYSQFMIATKGQCYQSFSAGKDSDVGRHIIDNIHNGTFKHITPQWDRVVSYIKPPLVFSNTGLEFPEVVQHSKQFETTVIKPKMGFTRVIAEIGVAVISKEVAQKIREIRTTKSDKLRNKRLYGDEKGNGKIPEKYKPYIEAPFLISDRCCHILKKEPFKRYEKLTGLKPIVFTTIKESRLREASYLQTGCNTLDEGKEKCRPLSIWLEFGTDYSDTYYPQFVFSWTPFSEEEFYKELRNKISI